MKKRKRDSRDDSGDEEVQSSDVESSRKKIKLTSVPSQYEAEALRIRRRLSKEIETSATNDEWKGHKLEKKNKVLKTSNVVRYRGSAPKVVKDAVQLVGEVHGCHTCLPKVAQDKDQPWHGDHNPPTNLSATGLTVLQGEFDGLDSGRVYLFPQCHKCSGRQASLVRKINHARTKAKIEPLVEGMDEDDKSAVVGRLMPITAGANFNCIEATSSKVRPGEGLTIQNLGKRHGCHSCDSEYPSQNYHTDHVFPKEFASHWAEELFKKLDLEYPDQFFYRPQCSRCSGAQGGDMSSLTKDALALAKKLGIIVYK